MERRAFFWVSWFTSSVWSLGIGVSQVDQLNLIFFRTNEQAGLKAFTSFNHRWDLKNSRQTLKKKKNNSQDPSVLLKIMTLFNNMSRRLYCSTVDCTKIISKIRLHIVFFGVLVTMTTLTKLTVLSALVDGAASMWHSIGCLYIWHGTVGSHKSRLWQLFN